VPERPKTGSGKKFSITIQVPDDVTAQWPKRATAEKLIQEVYAAMGAVSPAPAEPGTPAVSSVAAPRARRGSPAILLAALLVGGVIGGYLGARGFLELSASRDRAATMPRAAPAPARPSPAQPQFPPSPPQADLSVQPSPTAPQPTVPIQLPVLPGSEAGAAGTIFNVQVGAYRVQGNAMALISQLRQDGFNAHVVRFGDLYLVQIGSFHTRTEADRVVARLKAKHYEAFVVQLSASRN